VNAVLFFVIPECLNRESIPFISSPLWGEGGVRGSAAISAQKRIPYFIFRSKESLIPVMIAIPFLYLPPQSQLVLTLKVDPGVPEEVKSGR